MGKNFALRVSFHAIFACIMTYLVKAKYLTQFFSITEDGVLNFGFSLYIDELRSDGYSGQQLDLNFHLYARVEILSNPDYLTTMIDRCWSTPSSDRNDATSYDLIVNRYRFRFFAHANSCLYNYCLQRQCVTVACLLVRLSY